MPGYVLVVDDELLVSWQVPMGSGCGAVYNENVPCFRGIGARAEIGVATVRRGQHRTIEGRAIDGTETTQAKFACRFLPRNDRSHGLSRVASHVVFDLRPNEHADTECGRGCGHEDQECVDSPYLP